MNSEFWAQVKREADERARECPLCRGSLWVCEDHQNKPWGGASERPAACHCGAAGAPCPRCNPSDREHPPKMPAGYRSLIDSRTEGVELL